jgi:hypothetical protein
MPYADFQTLVTNLVRDSEGRITDQQRDNAIDLAVQRYSTDRPQSQKVDVAAAGGNVLAMPVGWDANFSVLLSVESPIGMYPPEYLEPERIHVYKRPDGVQELHFDDALPVGQVRVEFTVKQALVNAGADTIPLEDREAVCKWAAASLCDQLAALYSNSQDSTIQADTVQYQDKASARRRQADAFRKQYLDAMGIDDKKAAAAGVNVTLNDTDSLGGPRIFHGRRRLVH